MIKGQKGLTRSAALRLAQQKWGDGARASDARSFGFIVWDALDVLTDNDPRYGDGNSWRQACERAGLIPPEAPADVR